MNSKNYNKLLQELKNDEFAQDYFFSRIKISADPSKFLDILKNEGYFNPANNPPPIYTTDTPIRVITPQWNVLEYLEVVAKKNDENENLHVTNILTEFIDSAIDYRDDEGMTINNFRTNTALVRLIGALPINSISDKHLDFIKKVLKLDENISLIPHEISKSFIRKFKQDKDKLLKLLDIVLDYKISTKDLTGFGDKNEYISIMGDPWLADFIKINKQEISQTCGLDACKIALSKISKVIKRDRGEFNYIWIPTIEDHTQKTFTFRYDVQIVNFVRDMLELGKPDEIRKLVAALFKRKHPIFKRLAVHAINHHYSHIKAIFWKSQNNPISEPFLKHEIYELLKAHCKSFSDNELDIVLNWIENKNFHFRDEIKKDIKRKEKLESYGKKEWLTALFGLNHTKVNILYEKYNAIDNTIVEHPGLYTWSGFRSGDTSPLSVEVISKMDVTDIAQYLNKFQESGLPDSPTKEGLADVLKITVVKNSASFSYNLKAFLNTERLYQYSILSGLKEAWSSNYDFDWESVLDYCLELIKPESFWVEEHAQYYDYRDWIVHIIADLIIDGCKNDQRAYDTSLFRLTEELLLLLVSKVASNLEVSTDMATSVMNSSKGTILSACIIYSLRYARVFLKNEPKLKWKKEIKDIFDSKLKIENDSSAEFLFTIGKYFPNLWYLDKDWIEHNIDLIFPNKSSLTWEISFTGYLYSSNNIFEEIYDLLKLKNLYSLAITKSFKDKYVERRLIEHIYVGYLEGWEQLTESNSLISELINSENVDKLSILINLVSHGEGIDRSKVRSLWQKLYDVLIKHEADTKYQALFSDLCKWLALFEDIDDEMLPWLKLSAKYAELNFNAPTFIENLSKRVDTNSKQVGELYISMLEGGNFPLYDQNDIRIIIKTLYEKGQKEQANQIYNIYRNKSEFFLKDLYDSWNPPLA